MDGFEYMDLAEELEEYEGSFEQVVLADSLLTSDADFDAVAKAITEAMAEYDDGETAFCYMGHGTEADSNQVYPRLQETLKEAGYTDYFIGTVEAEPSLEDVTASLKEAGGYKRVVLRPLMVVAGDHANNDMAGDEEDSWKSVLNKEGYETECVLEGLGQIPATGSSMYSIRRLPWTALPDRKRGEADEICKEQPGGSPCGSSPAWSSCRLLLWGVRRPGGRRGHWTGKCRPCTRICAEGRDVSH